jgi:Histidine kinase
MDRERKTCGDSQPDVHDFWLRLLLSPVLGAALTNLSGLIDNSRHSLLSLVGSYLWFALVAFLIWEGNRWLYFRLPRREDWLLRPWHRLRVLLAIIVLYTIPVSAVLLWIWRTTTGDMGSRHLALPTTLFAVVAAVVVITHVYETVFLLRDWESARLRSARVEQARLQVELESLGREVDPHFLFNNLDALAHLVDRRSDAAPWFIRTLGATYRYVLECRGRPLVPLAEELEALERHRALADVRYGGAVRLDVNVQPGDADLLLPPVSLSELFQNALKHNGAEPDRPLHIRVRVDDAVLVFENDRRRPPAQKASTGVGLVNMRERFRLATGRLVTWSDDGDRFVVTLPLVRTDRRESRRDPDW